MTTAPILDGPQRKRTYASKDPLISILINKIINLKGIFNEKYGSSQGFPLQENINEKIKSNLDLRKRNRFSANKIRKIRMML